MGALAEVTSYGGWKHPEWTLYAGSLNLADLSAIVENVAAAPWEYPDYAQLWLRDEDDLSFSMWMFQGGLLRRLTVDNDSLDEDVYPGSTPAQHLRVGHVDDRDYLIEIAHALRLDHGGLVDAIQSCKFVRLERVAYEPTFVVALKHVHGQVSDTTSYERVAAGYLWWPHDDHRISDGHDAHIAIGVPMDVRPGEFGTAILGRLLRIAKSRGVSHLEATVDIADGWTSDLLENAGFSRRLAGRDLIEFSLSLA